MSIDSRDKLQCSRDKFVRGAVGFGVGGCELSSTMHFLVLI
ncbi:hypothetical protein BofuT4_uP123950.1 [Botrytis cinerea T4]|uniref:Uncharacterized protein n=1 Tax=Botryotinia fuckeliana (strain T4) TaxID=999810 RepID=G2YRU9_BOTF4|nr:hypothetical protein BofuT4_uP123950.1 [Botrytis cinerea T4]